MIRKYFTKNYDAATPIALKVGLFLAGWIYLGGAASHLTAHRSMMGVDPLGWSLGFVAGLTGFVLVIATWNLKRWAVVGLVALGFLNIALAAMGGANLLFVGAFRFVPLLPVAFYWKRMTWA